MLWLMDETRDVGPALQRLRESRGIRQAQVAERMGKSTQTVSRLEQPGSNPQTSSLLRYLEAIGATLADLEAELQAPADPLDEAVATVSARIRDEPAFRGLAREMLERYGGPDLPPALRTLADMIDGLEDRVRRLEEQSAPESESPDPKGTDSPNRRE